MSVGRNIRMRQPFCVVMGRLLIATLGLAVALLGIVVLSVPASADAASHRQMRVAPGFTDLPGESRSGATVGERYVVYGRDTGEDLIFGRQTSEVWITDTLTMTTRKAMLPHGCVLGSRYGSLHDRFLVACLPGTTVSYVPDSYIFDSATATAVAGPFVLKPGNSFYQAVGDQWAFGAIGGTGAVAGGYSRLYQNWHTGEVRELAGYEHLDIDDPALGMAANCAPFTTLKRMPVDYRLPSSGGPAHPPQDGRTAYVVKGKQFHETVYAGRCGGTGRLTKVHPIDKTTIDPGSINGGWSVWVTTAKGCGRTLHSYDDPSHRILTWTTLPTRPRQCFDLVGKTKYALITSRFLRTVSTELDEKGGVYKLYQLSIASRPQ